MLVRSPGKVGFFGSTLAQGSLFRHDGFRDPGYFGAHGLDAVGDDDETDGGCENGQGEEDDWIVDMFVVVGKGSDLRVGEWLGVGIIRIGGGRDMHSWDGVDDGDTMEE